MARINAKVYISITGRIKEMINRGGESTSASEIERLIERHPGVMVVAVVSMLDPALGERVCAYVQLKPGVRMSVDDVIGFLKEQKTSVLQFPDRIEFIADMPYTDAQKLDKKASRADIEKKIREGQAGRG
ncbi:MAG: hypothetical protein JW932_09785 [Deltaproteobacteria bacterium]|nr:hypothetical protein [Deltaproteobacteria bacterium]